MWTTQLDWAQKAIANQNKRIFSHDKNITTISNLTVYITKNEFTCLTTKIIFLWLKERFTVISKIIQGKHRINIRFSWEAFLLMCWFSWFSFGRWMSRRMYWKFVRNSLSVDVNLIYRVAFSELWNSRKFWKKQTPHLYKRTHWLYIGLHVQSMLGNYGILSKKGLDRSKIAYSTFNIGFQWKLMNLNQKNYWLNWSAIISLVNWCWPVWWKKKK